MSTNDVFPVRTCGKAGAAFALILLLLGGPGGAASSALAAQPQAPVLEVTVSSARMTVTAREVPLGDVLAAISRQAGVRIVAPDDLSTPVTETLVNVPLDEGIRRLSRGHSVVFLYDGAPSNADGATLSEAWVTSSSPAPNTDLHRSQRTAEVQRTDSHAAGARPAQLTRVLRFGPPDARTRTVEALVTELGPYRVFDILREAAARDPDPRIRRGAIQVLGSMNTPDAVEAVRTTLSDPHAGVRAEAQMALQRQTRARGVNR